MTINEMAQAAHKNSREHGFYDHDVSINIPEKIALIHSEASEALEEYRESRMEITLEENGKPIGFPTELADIAIRVGDLCGALGIDLEAAVKQKMTYNASRPYRHGGKAC